MVQRRRRLGLALKLRQGLRIFRDGGRQEFQRHVAAQPRVFCLVHHAHTTAAELFEDAVVRDRLPKRQLKFRHGAGMAVFDRN